MQRNSRITTENNDEQAISFVLHSDVVVLANKRKKKKKKQGKRERTKENLDRVRYLPKRKRLPVFPLLSYANVNSDISAEPVNPRFSLASV